MRVRELLPSLVLLLLTFPPAPAAAVDCRDAGADCSLGEAALQAGIDFGGFRQENTPEAAATIAAENSSVTVPVYWTSTQAAPGVFDFSGADDIVALGEENGLSMRGHPLVWEQAGLDGTPDWVTGIPDAATLRAVLQTHIDTVIGRYRGRITAWDVVNEPIQTLGSAPYANHFRQVLGPSYIAEVLAMARAADPGALLFVNEIVFGLAPLAPGKLDAFLDLVRDLVDQDAPIDGVGFQGHLFSPAHAADVIAALREVEALGLIAEITELDAPQRNVPDPDAEQTREMRELVAACLIVPACRRITVWGVSDAYSWLNWFLVPGLRPLLFDDEYQPKPVYFGVRDALMEAIPRDLSGRRLALRDDATRPERRRLKLRSTDPAIQTRGAVDLGDPTELGAQLRLLNPGSGEEVRIELSADGWEAVGRPPGSAGYRYREPGVGPCPSVRLRAGRLLRVRCRGAGMGFTLDEAAQNGIAVELRVGDAPLQCLEFGGEIRRDFGTSTSARGGGRFVARAAPASDRCGAP